MSVSNRSAGSPALAEQGERADSGDQSASANNDPSDSEASAVAPPVEEPARPNEAVEGQSQTEGQQANPYNARDIVAQEAMADASIVMAIAAFLTFFVTLAGTLLIWRQVKLTREAVKDTGEATDAMREANRIAADNSKRQLRAYLTIEPHGINEAGEDGLCRVPVKIHNTGQTPAHKLMLFGQFAITDDPINFDPANHGDILSGQNSDGSLGCNQPRFAFAYLSASFAEPYMPDVRDKKRAIVHFGYVTYHDVFEEEHKTYFAFYHWGPELSDDTSLRCRSGNSAT